MAEIAIRKLNKSFGETQILDQIDLTVRDGEFMTLVGPSGCGKSTLLRIIAGLESQTNGQINISGQPVDQLRPKDRNLSMVFQSYALYPHLTVKENIATPIRMRSYRWYQRLPLLAQLLPGAAERQAGIDSKVAAVAELLQIEHLLDRRPGELSGGQRQRVALGRAMVRDPAAFLMDEPLSNLDAKLRVHMRTEIAQLHKQLGTTFIYVTHDQAEAMTMSDRIALMMDGELLQVATPEEIYRNPVDVRVAEFIGSPKINLLPGEVNNAGRVVVCGCPLRVATLPGLANIRVGVRPENATVCRAEQGDIQGRLIYLENMGAEFFAHITIDTLAEPMLVRCDVEQGQQLLLGATVGIRIKPKHTLVFDQQGRRVVSEKVAAEVHHESVTA
ncbi:ABC transporter ATP-binding protein [Amphritea sp.]|uniref:ABC transporter ATP-binding protein n=1 Tax=Amphritea sp. TaxID=1872502 RepID=UPI003A90F042